VCTFWCVRVGNIENAHGACSQEDCICDMFPRPTSVHVHCAWTEGDHWWTVLPCIPCPVCSWGHCCYYYFFFKISIYILPMPAAVVGVGFSLAFVCLFACLFFCTNVSKTDVATITKLNIEMFHYESWKPIYFRVKRSRVPCGPRQSLPYSFTSSLSHLLTLSFWLYVMCIVYLRMHAYFCSIWFSFVLRHGSCLPLL